MGDNVLIAKIIASLSVLPISVYAIMQNSIVVTVIIPISFLVLVAIHVTNDGKRMHHTKQENVRK